MSLQTKSKPTEQRRLIDRLFCIKTIQNKSFIFRLSATRKVRVKLLQSHKLYFDDIFRDEQLILIHLTDRLI